MKPFCLLALCVVLPVFASAGPLDDKTPGYYTDRYGPAKSSSTASVHGFINSKYGSVDVKGQFSVRKFRKDDLTVEPVYFLPSLELAGVRLRLPRAWTKEQIEAALAAYGGEWQPAKGNGVSNTWIAPDGSVAIQQIASLEIQSKKIVDLIERTLAEEQAKKKAVPKF